MANEGIELEIYKFSSPTVKAKTLTQRRAPKTLTELNGVGGGSFTISKQDPTILNDPTLLKSRNICKVKVDGVVVNAFLIGERGGTQASAGEAAEANYDIVGTGLKTWFDDADVYPANGLQTLSQDSRFFNFASEVGSWYVAGSWIDPYILGPLSRYATEDWPAGAPDAKWIWASPALAEMPGGTCYFRWTVNITTAGPYAIYLAADDEFTLYVDGALLATSPEQSTSWHKATRIETNLTVGTHTIAFGAANRLAPGYNGPAGLLSALFKVNLDKTETLIGNSGAGTWKALPYPATTPGWTAGEVVLKLLAEAQARGVLFPTWVTPTFTATTDSNGVAWADKISWEFKTSESMASVMGKMEELYDVWINPANYQLNIYQTRGTTKNTPGSQVSLYLGKHLRQAKTTAKGQIKNALAVKTINGWQENTSPSSIAIYGRLESSLDTGTTPELANKIVTMLLSSRSIEEIGATYDFIAVEKIPFVDFNVGDWILAPDETGLNQVLRRVMSISVEEDEQGNPQYTIEFDTIFRDNEQKLSRIVQKLSGGGAGSTLGNVAGSTPGVGQPIVVPPTSPPVELLTPKAPTGLGVSSLGYWSADGVKSLSQATLTWAAVTQNTNDTGVVPQVYEVEGRPTAVTNSGFEPLGQYGTTTAVIRGFDPLAAWDFRVRAISAVGGVGDWSSIVSHTMAAPVMSMLVPDPPTMTSSRGTMTVNWDGLLGGAVPPPEFRYVYAEVGAAEAGPFQRMGPSLSRDGRTLPIPGLIVGNQYWVRLTAVDGSGFLSSPSPAISHTIKGIVGPDIQAASVDANVLIAGSVKTNHLSPEVGNELVINGNVTITSIAAAADDAAAAAAGAQANLNTMQTYYSFGPTGAVISKPGSVFATAIRNNQIEMLENGNVISYWNSGTLYVNQLVGTKVTLGNHQIEQFGADDTIVRAL